MSIKRSIISTQVERDPLLTFDFIISDLGCSKATFQRGPRLELSIAQISPRRLGVRASDYAAWKASKIRPPLQGV